MYLTAILDFAEKNDVHPSRFFYIFNMFFWNLSGNKSEEKASVAICGGLSHNLAYIDWPNGYVSPRLVIVGARGAICHLHCSFP